MTDRLRETDALAAKNLRIESKVILEIARQIKRGEAHVGDDLDYISDIMRESAELIERQGKALRAVKQLCVARCNANEYDIEPYDPTIAFIATVYAALAQTEPQTADEAKENPS